MLSGNIPFKIHIEVLQVTEKVFFLATGHFSRVSNHKKIRDLLPRVRAV